MKTYEGLRYSDDFEVCYGFENEDDKNKEIVLSKFHPNCVKIAREAFCRCNIIKLDLSNTAIEEIGYWAFHECKKLVEVILPETFEVLLGEAFCDCENLKKMNFPSSLRFLDNYSLLRTKLVELDLSKTKIKALHYGLGGEELTSIKLPDGLLAIFDCGYPNLTKIELPDSVVYINESAFENSKITDVNLPKSIEFIEWSWDINITWHISTLTPNMIKVIALDKLNHVSDDANLGVDIEVQKFLKSYKKPEVTYFGSETADVWYNKYKDQIHEYEKALCTNELNGIVNNPCPIVKRNSAKILEELKENLENDLKFNIYPDIHCGYDGYVSKEGKKYDEKIQEILSNLKEEDFDSYKKTFIQVLKEMQFDGEGKKFEKINSRVWQMWHAYIKNVFSQGEENYELRQKEKNKIDEDFKEINELLDKKHKESGKVRNRWFKDYGKLKEAHLKTYNIVPELKKLFDEFNDSEDFYLYNRNLKNASELEFNILDEFKKITNSNVDDYLGTFIEAMNSSEDIYHIEGFIIDLVDAISLAICGKDYATYFYNHTYKEQKQIAEKLKVLFWEYGKHRLPWEGKKYYCHYQPWF